MTFEKFTFKSSQVQQYYAAACKDFLIAKRSNVIEVRFRFSYDALLKLAIAIAAKNGQRVKARQGHHVKLIEYLAHALRDKDVLLFGNDMRTKRNRELYDGGTLLSHKDVDDYILWLEKVFETVEKLFRGSEKLL